jgi:hypothetical protein
MLLCPYVGERYIAQDGLKSDAVRTKKCCRDSWQHFFMLLCPYVGERYIAQDGLKRGADRRLKRPTVLDDFTSIPDIARDVTLLQTACLPGMCTYTMLLHIEQSIRRVGDDYYARH